MENEIVELFQEKTGKSVVKLRKLNGLSNHVYKVKDHEGLLWIFKVLMAEKNDPFKKMERVALDLVAEMENSTVFDDGHFRIEKFIQNKNTTLKQVMYATEGPKIMRAISEFNQLRRIEASSPNLFYILRNDSEPLFEKIERNLDRLSRTDRGEIEKMMLEVSDILRSTQDAYKFDSLVLSHNDLFYRNIIFGTEKSKYVLIDFEYAGYNPLGMDIFQFVNEFLIDYDIDEAPFFKLQLDQYPSEASLRDLIRFYLFFSKHKSMVDGMPDSNEMIQFVRETEEFKEISDSSVSDILRLFPYFGVITNIFWFYWGLYLFEIENISLNYVEFAKAKYQMVRHFLIKLQAFSTISKAPYFQ